MARPYIWRLTSLSLVIWPSVWPLDQDVVIAALTAALSLMMPLAKDATRLAHARSSHGSRSAVSLLADHGVESGDDLSSLHQERNALLDRRDGDGLGL